MGADENKYRTPQLGWQNILTLTIENFFTSAQNEVSSLKFTLTVLSDGWQKNERSK
jgi:hypothetical protein